jgi:hypothetical protein
MTVSIVDDTLWWTWKGNTRRQTTAHVRVGDRALCGKGPVWYAADDETWRHAPAEMAHCRACARYLGL